MSMDFQNLNFSDKQMKHDSCPYGSKSKLPSTSYWHFHEKSVGSRMHSSFYCKDKNIYSTFVLSMQFHHIIGHG